MKTQISHRHVEKVLMAQPMVRPNRSSTRAMDRLQSSRSAFTLIELLLVLAILGVLMAMAIPNLLGRQQHANIDVTRGSIVGIEQALEMYQLDHQGNVPSTREGLECLVRHSNQSDKRWRGPYLKKLPLDAWGTQFEYFAPGKQNSESFDIVSAGPDRKHGTADDIGNWE